MADNGSSGNILMIISMCYFMIMIAMVTVTILAVGIMMLIIIQKDLVFLMEMM